MISATLRSWSPWSPADGLRWAVLAAVGHALAVAAWWFARRQDALNDQVSWATVAVAAFAIVGYADISWVLQARFAIIQRRQALLVDGAVVSMPARQEASRRDQDVVVGGPGLSLFHRPTCALVTGKQWDAIDLPRVLAEDRKPCGVCRP